MVAVLHIPKESLIERRTLELFPKLYLPMSRMSIGRSPNLLSNGDFEAGTTGWNAINATVAQETTVVQQGTKSLKVTSTGTWAKARQSISNPTFYRGITGSLSGYMRASSSNTINGSKIAFYDSDGATNNDAVTTLVNRDDTWYLKTTSLKFRATLISILVEPHSNYSANNTSGEIAYADNLLLTVPQSISRDVYARNVHPEGCLWTPQGFSFDGVDDLITCEVDPIADNACTVMGWIYLNGWGEGNLGRIVDNGKFIFLVNSGSGNRLSFSSDGSTTKHSEVNSLALSKWIHVAVTRTAAGVANFYINGQLSGAADQDSGTPASGTTLLCVGNELAGSKTFNGKIDELSIYTQALSPLTIRNHYELTKGMKL